MSLKTKVIAEEILRDIPYKHSEAHKQLANSYLSCERQIEVLNTEIKKLKRMCGGCRF